MSDIPETLILSAYGVTVRNAKPGEEIQMVLRRHWIMYIFLGGWCSLPVIFTIAYLFLNPGLSAVMGTGISILILIVMWFIAVLFIYVVWLDYELDLFVITNRRIIGIEQISFLNRTVSECSLIDVQEVNAQTKGILANIFNFGIITINTASENSHFRVSITPHALDNARIIRNIIDEYKGRAMKRV